MDVCIRAGEKTDTTLVVDTGSDQRGKSYRGGGSERYPNENCTFWTGQIIQLG